MSYTTKYPSTIPAASAMYSKTDDVDFVKAADFDGLKNELHAVMVELGVTPSGSSSTVAARFDAVGSIGCQVSDQKSDGTQGGTFTKDAWQTRNINTEDYDPDNICSISSNQITLGAGTYEISVIAPYYQVGSTKLRLYDTTGSAILLGGINGFSTGTVSAVFYAFLEGRFTLTEESVLEIQHYCTTTKTTNGFGIANTYGVNEIYTTAVIKKVG